MTDYKYSWQEPLHQALLEMDRTKLEQKIKHADAVIRARIDELAVSSDSFKEKLALEDALQTLRYLRGLPG